MHQPLKTLMDGLLEPTSNWKATLLRGWERIIGPLHTKVSLLKIDHETLTLGVTDACWMHELYLLSPLLLKTINEKLDQPRVKQLRFKQTRTKQQKRSQSQRVKQEEGVETPLSPSEQRVLEGIQDTALREALQRFRSRCCRERRHEKKNHTSSSVRHRTAHTAQSQTADTTTRVIGRRGDARSERSSSRTQPPNKAK